MNARKAHTSFDCTFRVHLDGQPVGGIYLFKDEVVYKTKAALYTGETTGRSFMFNTLKVTGMVLSKVTYLAFDSLTDDESSLQHLDFNTQIGEIKIVLWRVSEISSPTPIVKGSLRVPDLHDVHERAKKAASHRVQ